MFDTYPAPLRMSRVTDRNGNWLNSDSYCIFHMACLHELGALRLQTAAPEYAAAPRDRRERLFVSLFTQHFSMRHNKLCDNKKKRKKTVEECKKAEQKARPNRYCRPWASADLKSRKSLFQKIGSDKPRAANKQTNKRPQ